MSDFLESTGFRGLVVVIGLLAAVAAGAASPAPALPGWQVLEFEQRAFRVTARSHLELVADTAVADAWQFSATSSVSDNSETVTLKLDPASGRALSRTRLSQGRDQRYKSWEFDEEYTVRTRRVPERDPSAPPEEWPVSTRLEVFYPDESAGLVITDAYALLLLAGRLLGESAQSTEVVVYTDFNFYRVRLTPGDGPQVKVDYVVEGEGQAVKGKVQTRAVSLAVSPLVDLEDKPDFSLLGMERDIKVLFDPASGVPVQLRGAAPRIGDTTINLVRMVPRKP